MRSSSLPMRTSQDGNTVVNFSGSPMSTVAGDGLSDMPLLPNIQLNDRRHSEGNSSFRAGSSSSEMADRGTTIDDLPDELILEIFSYMSINESTHVLQKVCTRWKILAHDPHLWHNQRFVFSDLTSEEDAIETFEAMPQLRTVILEKEVSPVFFEALSRKCPLLTCLETDYQQMLTYSEADNLFSRCKRIRTLKICSAGLRADVRFLDAVARLADLRVLHLKDSFAQNVVVPLRVLADNCPHLHDLDLGQPCSLYYQIADAEYFVNAQKSVLRSLRIWSTSIEGRSISPLLPRVETLQNLELIHCGIGGPEDFPEAITALGHLHRLQKLHFGVNDWGLRLLVPEVFGYGGLPHLQQLSLEDYVVDDTMRAVAEHCPELRELKLSRCEGHTDALLEPLFQLKKLQKLKISYCRCLDGKAVAFIAKVAALQTLEFTNIRFDKLKPSLHCILEMSGLRRLYLDSSKCDDIPFDKFPGRLVNLRELEIGYCDGDQKVLDRILAQMPDLKVEGSLGAIITTSDDQDYGEYYEEGGD